MAATRSTKFVAFGCTHFPLQDKRAIDWAVETIVREKPDQIVFLGDGIEANAASQWDDAKELGIELQSEYDSLNVFLASVRKAAPRAKRKFLAGNHESNVTRIGRMDPRIRSLVDWSSRRNVPEWEHWSVSRTYNYSRRLGSFWLGPMCFAHGYEANARQIETEVMYFTKNWPFSGYISAHTHRPTPVQEIVWKDIPLNRWYGNPGCLRDLEPGYMERKRKWKWGHGIVIGEAVPLKSPRMAKEWDARVEVLQMYDD